VVNSLQSFFGDVGLVGFVFCGDAFPNEKRSNEGSFVVFLVRWKESRHNIEPVSAGIRGEPKRHSKDFRAEALTKKGY